jgi:hypothetical protein
MIQTRNFLRLEDGSLTVAIIFAHHCRLTPNAALGAQTRLCNSDEPFYKLPASIWRWLG